MPETRSDRASKFPNPKRLAVPTRHPHNFQPCLAALVDSRVWSGRQGSIDTRARSATIRPWASTAARWKLSGRPRLTLRPPPDSPPGAQVLADVERLIAVWNERQARRMPLLFAPTIGAALWVYCSACRTTRDVDLRALDRHRDAAVTSLIPSQSCRSCRPHSPFAQLVRLSKTSIADEMRIEHTRRASANNRAVSIRKKLIGGTTRNRASW
jgi:hypothetical protein